jgi:SAM-dependent methyltransferase
MARDWRALNRASWDERAALHAGPGGYDRAPHRAGRGRLDPIAGAVLGDVAGRRVLHLQCHTGDDTVAIAQIGAAEAVGLDFSPVSLEAARALAAECHARAARFVFSDVLEAPAALPGERFDVVFASWGVIGWLPDIAAWARVVAHFLRPGGVFAFAEGHPAAWVFDDQEGRLDAAGRPGWLVPYFERAPREFIETQDYVPGLPPLRETRTVQWLHPLGDVLGALLGAGLVIERFAEHPRVPWRMFASLVPDAEGMWGWPAEPWLPLGYSLRAHRPG